MTSYNKTAIEAQSLTTQLERSLKLMKVQIDANSKEEGEAIKKALAHDATKAAVVIVGVLSDLSDEEQKRVLRFVTESLGVITGD